MMLSSSVSKRILCIGLFALYLVCTKSTCTDTPPPEQPGQQQPHDELEAKHEHDEAPPAEAAATSDDSHHLKPVEPPPAAELAQMDAIVNSANPAQLADRLVEALTGSSVIEQALDEARKLSRSGSFSAQNDATLTQHLIEAASSALTSPQHHAVLRTDEVAAALDALRSGSLADELEQTYRATQDTIHCVKAEIEKRGKSTTHVAGESVAELLQKSPAEQLLIANQMLNQPSDKTTTTKTAAIDFRILFSPAIADAIERQYRKAARFHAKIVNYHWMAPHVLVAILVIVAFMLIKTAVNFGLQIAVCWGMFVVGAFLLSMVPQLLGFKCDKRVCSFLTDKPV